MTAPTRRQLMAGSLAAVGAAGAPAIALAVTPEERVRLALAELEAAFRAYYPDAYVETTFNGVTPLAMQPRPHETLPGAYWGGKRAGALVFASIRGDEHGKWYTCHDDDMNGVALAADRKRP